MEKRLYKSSSDKVLAGVCGGIGEYFDVDPVLIRVLWVVAAFFGGVGVLAYIIAAIIMPEKDTLNRSKTYESTYKSPASADQRSGAGQRNSSGQTDREKTGTTGETQSQTQPKQTSPHHETHAGKDPAPLAGVILVALGGFFLMREFMPWISGGILAAVLFMALGVFMLMPRTGGKR